MEQKLLDELAKRREKILQSGGPERLEKRKAENILSARERLDSLFDPGTLQEHGMHSRHSCSVFGMAERDIPSDGVVGGMGLVDGRLIGAFSQDFTVLGGTVGAMHAKKICDVMSNAMSLGVPVVGFNDSGGARIQEGVYALSGYGQIFHKNVELSGLVPQIAVIAGPCAGGAAYSPALCDFVVMVRDKSHMFICGPEVIKTSTGHSITAEEIGSAEIHSTIAGNAHFTAGSDEEAIQLVRKLLSYLPSNNLTDPPHDLTNSVTLSHDPELGDIVPTKGTTGYDVKKIIRTLVDSGDFLEVQERFAPNLVVGFGRMCGVVVGIVANQPMVKAGTLDIDASDKGARFIRFCDCFSIPLLSLVDTPGFLPGVQQEKSGIIRHGAKMLFAFSSATVPKVTLILRKAYGGAYLAMCSKDLGADAVFAWPTAEIAVMGAEQAVRILYRREIDEAENKEAKAKEFAVAYRERFASPYEAAGAGMLTDIITPAETRRIISQALRNFVTKRGSRPPKKHGNIPL